MTVPKAQAARIPSMMLSPRGSRATGRRARFDPGADREPRPIRKSRHAPAPEAADLGAPVLAMGSGREATGALRRAACPKTGGLESIAAAQNPLWPPRHPGRHPAHADPAGFHMNRIHFSPGELEGVQSGRCFAWGDRRPANLPDVDPRGKAQHDESLGRTSSRWTRGRGAGQRRHDAGGLGSGSAADRHDRIGHSAHHGSGRQWRRRHALHRLHGLRRPHQLGPVERHQALGTRPGPRLVLGGGRHRQDQVDLHIAARRDLSRRLALHRGIGGVEPRQAPEERRTAIRPAPIRARALAHPRRRQLPRRRSDDGGDHHQGAGRDAALPDRLDHDVLAGAVGEAGQELGRLRQDPVGDRPVEADPVRPTRARRDGTQRRVLGQGAGSQARQARPGAPAGGQCPRGGPALGSGRLDRGPAAGRCRLAQGGGVQHRHQCLSA